MKFHLLTRRSAMLAAVALSLSPWVSAQQDFSKVEISAQKLSDTVYMLTGAGGNMGLCVGPDSVFLVDDQFAPLAPKIKAAVARITPRPVQWLLNTHFHFDHTGGNEAFGSTGTLIVAHDNVRRRMSSDQLIALGGNTNTQKASPKVALPVVTVPGEIRFHINGEEVHAFHVPRAHTDGDLIVHFRGSDVIHMGDVFFNGWYPFIDGSSGGSPDGVIAAYDRVLALAGEKTRIIPARPVGRTRRPGGSAHDAGNHLAARAGPQARRQERCRSARRKGDGRLRRPLRGGFIKPRSLCSSCWA